MARGLRSRRNVALSTVGPSKSKRSISPKEIPATSDIELPDTPTPDALVFAPVSAKTSTNRLFQQFMKAYLENQNQVLTTVLIQAEFWEQSLKVWFPDLYYENSHLDC